MRGFSALFSRSPFAPLQTHMEKVAACIGKLEELFKTYKEENFERISQLAEEISELEHAADLTKNKIRNNLPKGLFLAIDRGDLLQILATQDAIADTAEDIAVLFTLKNLEPLPDLEKELEIFLNKNIEAFHMAHQIIREMDELLASSFGGNEAEKVRRMTDEVSLMEHEADIQQRSLGKKMFNIDDKYPYTSFMLWNSIIRAMASLGNLSENLADRIRMLLDLKK
ncbi:TIGR00153 family protein [candidate division KSB1 bacterium]|nr:TIGR00153 family protein [candidate division KSB1 bacterium]